MTQRKTYVLICDVVGSTERVHNGLRDLRGKLIIAQKAGVEDADRRNSVIILHLISLGAAAAKARGHDAGSVDIQSISTGNCPFDSLHHPLDRGRAAIATRRTRGDGNEAIRGDLGEEVLGRCPIVATSTVSPDEHRHGAFWICGRSVDRMARESLVSGERHRAVGPVREGNLSTTKKRKECLVCDLPITLTLALDGFRRGRGRSSSKDGKSKLHVASTMNGDRYRRRSGASSRARSTQSICARA